VGLEKYIYLTYSGDSWSMDGVVGTKGSIIAWVEYQVVEKLMQQVQQ